MRFHHSYSVLASLASCADVRDCNLSFCAQQSNLLASIETVTEATKDEDDDYNDGSGFILQGRRSKPLFFLFPDSPHDSPPIPFFRHPF